MKIFLWILLSVTCCSSQKMLEFIDAVGFGSGPDHPVDVAVSPDGESVYTTTEWGCRLTTFDRDTSSGVLYGTGYFESSSLIRRGLSGAMGVAVSPDNKNVYVTGLNRGSLVVFNRDTSAEHNELAYDTEFINGENGIQELAGATSVAVSRDNKNVYVSAAESSSIVMFKRDTSTGALEYAGYLKDGQDGIEGLHDVLTIAISPDDRNIYTASYAESSLVVLNRDTSTGRLMFGKCFKDRRDSVDGLGNASSVAVSPDNKNVYAVCWFYDGLSVFSRDLSTGALTYKKCIKTINGDSIPNQLDMLKDVEVSRDNNYVYVISGKTQNAVLVFNRNVSTGDLTYSFSMKNNHDGVRGMIGARRVAVSPDDKNVYAVSDYDDAIASFRRIEPVSTKQLTNNTGSVRGAGAFFTTNGRICRFPSAAKTSGTTSYSLFDMHGRLVGHPFSAETSHAHPGISDITADLSSIPDGTYLLRSLNGSEIVTAPLVIAR